MAITVADLRAQLDNYPDDTIIFACDGIDLLDVLGLETPADILRWHQEQHTPADVQQALARSLAVVPNAIYVELVHFA